MTIELDAPPAPTATALADASVWRAGLKTGRAALKAAFYARPDTGRLLVSHARLVDRVLRDVWTALRAPPEAALVAVGGYGRGQIYPHSDVDVLILLREAADG